MNCIRPAAHRFPSLMIVNVVLTLVSILVTSTFYTSLFIRMYISVTATQKHERRCFSSNYRSDSKVTSRQRKGKLFNYLLLPYVFIRHNSLKNIFAVLKLFSTLNSGLWCLFRFLISLVRFKIFFKWFWWNLLCHCSIIQIHTKNGTLKYYYKKCIISK